MLYDNGEKSFVLLSGVGEDMGKYLHKPCVNMSHKTVIHQYFLTWFVTILQFQTQENTYM